MSIISNSFKIIIIIRNAGNVLFWSKKMIAIGGQNVGIFKSSFLWSVFAQDGVSWFKH